MIVGGMENTHSTAMHVEQSGSVLSRIAQYRVAENIVLCPSVYGRLGKLLTSCGFFMTVLLLPIYAYQLA
jgi:hypothetical protein